MMSTSLRLRRPGKAGCSAQEGILEVKKLMIVSGVALAALLVTFVWRSLGSENGNLEGGGEREVNATSELGETTGMVRRSKRLEAASGAGAEEATSAVTGPEDALTSPEGEYGLTVRVQSQFGKPLPNAAVYLIESESHSMVGFDLFRLMGQIFKTEGAKATGSTGLSGEATFSALPPGDYQVAVFKDGFEARYSENVSIVEGILPMPLRLRLRKGFTLKGIVVDSADQPIEGAVIAVLPEMDGLPSSIQTLKQTTGADGLFSFATLADRDHHLIVHADGFAPVGTKDLGVGKEVHRIHMTPGGSLEGRITDETTGAGIEGAAVALMADESFVVATTDSEGAYRMGNVPESKRVKVIVKAAGYSVSDPKARREFLGQITADEPVVAGQTTTVDIVMVPMGVVRGQVIDAETGTGVEGASVRALGGLFMAGGGSGSATTDEQGNYELTASGSDVALQVSKTGFVSKDVGSSQGFFGRNNKANKGNSVKIKVFPGRVTDVPVIKLERGRVVAGRVVNAAGQGVANAAISWLPEKSGRGFLSLIVGGRVLTVGSNADGGFELTGLPNVGDISLNARHPSYPAGGAAVVMGPSLGGVVITLRSGGTVKGTLKSVDGVLLKNMKIDCTSGKSPSQSGNPVSLMNSGHSVMTDQEGRFEFNSIPPGDMYLSLPRGGSAHRLEGVWLPITVAEGKATTLDLQCVQLFAITGVVQDPEGKPLSRANVQAKAGPATMRSDRTDKQGRFNITALPAGLYTLTATRRGRETGTVGPLSAGSLDVVIVLAKKKKNGR